MQTTNNARSLLPSNIAGPMFHLFQSVRTKETKAVVTGVQYIDLITALMNENTRTGWLYTLNLTYGKSPQELLELNHRDEVVFEAWEDSIQPAEEN